MRQLANNMFKPTIWLALAIIIAGMALQASEITGISSLNGDNSVTLKLDSDSALQYEQSIDYAEWMMLVDFPGSKLGPAMPVSAFDFPAELAPWVRSYQVESTTAGSRLVLVLGERATPLNIALSRDKNSLLIAIPTTASSKAELISVPLGFRDPPVRFWEVSNTGAYRVIPLTSVPADAKAEKVEPTPRAIKPKSLPSSGERSFLVPRGIGEKAAASQPENFKLEAKEAGTTYTYNDFAPKPKAEPAPAPVAAPSPVEAKPSPEPEAAPSPIIEALDKETLEKMAEQPGETIVRIEGEPRIEPVAEETSTSGELAPDQGNDRPSWTTVDEKRAMDEAAGNTWTSPYPWDVDQSRIPEYALPDRSMLELPQIDRERITYECVNTPMSQAINLMVASTSFNVIVDDSVSASTVTLSFRDTPLREALDSITAANDLAYTMVHNTIVIGKRDDIGRRLGGFITRSFQLNYADAEAVKKVLVDNGVVSDKNVGVYNGEAASLTVATGGTVLSESEGGVNAGDIREIKNLVSTARRNTLVVTETKERMDIVAGIIQEIDRKPRLITLETSIVEISETGLKNIGFTVPNSTSTTVREETPAAADGIAMGLFLQTFYRDPLSVIVTLNHQIELGNARILSRPNLSAVDGSQAIYFAGRMIPYIKKPGTNTGTTFNPPEVGFQAVGITLSFKPRVDREGNITMDVNPSVSTLLRLVDLGSGATAPETQTRQVTTTIRIKNQETFVIAGLLSEEERKTMRKFPLLGDIPLFGKLFQSENNTSERTEIMVFVTPTVHD
jgi:type II secretory pathway component GspD/PulD (secretin)